MDYMQQTNLSRGLSDLIRRINLGADGTQIGEDLFGVADLLRKDHALASALTDPGRDASDRQGLARKIFEPVLCTGAMQSFYDLVGDNWSRERDLSATTARLGLDAYMLAAVHRDKVSTVAEELVLASMLISENRDLRIQLSDLGEGSAEERSALAKKVFHGHVSPITERLIMRAAFTSDYGRLLETLRAYADRSAQLDGNHLVIVTSAEPLSDEQRARMLDLARRRWNEPVELVAVTDPNMLGGFKLDGGDRAVDTSIRTNIAAARAALTR